MINAITIGNVSAACVFVIAIGIGAFSWAVAAVGALAWVGGFCATLANNRIKGE